MPTDPKLVPTSQDPQARIMERLAQLEGQMRGLQVAKTPTFQKVGTTNLGPDSPFTWRGGECWALVGGDAISNAAGGFGAEGRVNGFSISSHGSTASIGLQQMAMPFQAAKISNLGILVVGSNTFSVALAGNTFSSNLQALIIEWSL